MSLSKSETRSIGSSLLAMALMLRPLTDEFLDVCLELELFREGEEFLTFDLRLYGR